MIKLSKQECDEISGGFAISTIFSSILASIPVISTFVTSTFGLIRSISSDKGEIKTKDGFLAKWEDGNNKQGFNIGFHYCM
ncbi:hypothetical protein [Metamycoplasma canadense]|uniref:hypothetical protein n=1 Tax=Metamycoplasma canadense TaxID=29554 RepID=UPI0005EEC351|nr:hypothetical protein [Metamycoplasma canadense]